MLDRKTPLAIYMQGAVQGPDGRPPHGGKMGLGVLRYSPNPIRCVVDSVTAGRSIQTLTGIPKECPIVASLEEAGQLGAEALVLGIAPAGGLMPAEWLAVVDDAVRRGFSIVNGLHDLLSPRYPSLPRKGQFIWDIRVEPADLKPGTGAAAALTNRRLLMIGTDMAVGKMTAGLEIWRQALERGVQSEFVATGQIGITIMGSGVPLDAVRLDFAAGCIEREVMRWSPPFGNADLVVIEGQGSLGHPGSTANLALLRGACPTHLVLCHRARQTHLVNLPKFQVPDLKCLIRLYEDLASACGVLTRPRTAGVCLNTSAIESEEVALAECQALSASLDLPCVDPIRHGTAPIVDALN